MKHNRQTLSVQFRQTPHRLSLDHVADSLIEGVHLMGLQVAHDGSDVIEDLLNERHHLQLLHLHKMPPTLLSYLDERVARHVLNTVVSF